MGCCVLYFYLSRVLTTAFGQTRRCYELMDNSGTGLSYRDYCIGVGVLMGLVRCSRLSCGAVTVFRRCRVV